MNSIMKIPGLKDVNIEKIEEVGERTSLHVSLPRQPQNALNVGQRQLRSMITVYRRFNTSSGLNVLTVLFL